MRLYYILNGMVWYSMVHIPLRMYVCMYKYMYVPYVLTRSNGLAQTDR